MYGYNTEESRREGCLKTAAAHREAAALFPAIRKVFEQFDGKVLNCRLEKALQEATERRIYVRKDEYSVEVYIYINDYRGNTWYTLAHVTASKLKDGKRIPAADLIKSARERREDNLRTAAELEAAPGKVPEIIERVQYFVSMANQMLKGLPYEVCDMYNISTVRMR